MADTTARVLKLLSLLQAHRMWTGEELAGHLGVTERTIRRDIERLRELGYPVKAATGPTGGYQLAAGKNMPPLLLDDEEAIAIAVGLRTAAGGTINGIEDVSLRALAKLEQILPPRIREKVNSIQTTVTPVTRVRVAVDAELLSLLGQVCRDSERLRFDYTDGQGVSSERNVEPHQMVFINQRWYLVGFDRTRDDWRTFRIDRIEDPFRTKQRFEPRPIPGGDARQYMRDSLAAMNRRFEVELIVDAPADTIAPHLWSGSEVEAMTDGRSRLILRGDSLEGMAFSILWLDADFELTGPPELIEILTSLHRRIGQSIA